MNKRHSYFNSEFRAIEVEDKPVVEGYFIKYNTETNLWGNVYEEISPESVTKSLKDNDIRALFNHNDDIVLGRTGNKTVQLESRKDGLWGTININKDDPEAMGAYARIKRGDVTGCSFGFMPTKQEEIQLEDGGIKFVIKEMDLFEVSPCVFPAYPQTEISARKKDVEQLKREKLELRKKNLKERLLK